MSSELDDVQYANVRERERLEEAITVNVIENVIYSSADRARKQLLPSVIDISALSTARDTNLPFIETRVFQMREKKISSETHMK